MRHPFPLRSGARSAANVALLVFVAACAPGPSGLQPASPLSFVRAASSPPQPTHGIAIGDVDSTSAIVWSRSDRPATLHVRIARGAEAQERTADVDARHDFAASIRFEGLRPNTAYDVEAWFEAADSRPNGYRVVRDGSFRTAPESDSPTAVRFGFGGDVAGQNVCRDRFAGLPVFDVLAESNLDFFVGLGDMIYADAPCRAEGRYGNPQVPGPQTTAEDLPGYWARWRYVRGDEGQQRLLARTPLFATWDDHEIRNDFDPVTDARRETPLLAPARQAFLDWNPIRVDPSEPTRLHRTVRWGRHLELFILDTRQHRDPDRQRDSSAAPKTMLGAEQRRWLEESLIRSDATWKLVVSSVTLAVASGSLRHRDGWANDGTDRGFEVELRGILERLRSGGVTGLGFLSADVHFGAVFRHAPFADTPEFAFLELVSGPMNARTFPMFAFDRTLGTERLFYYGPAPDQPVLSYGEARAWMNACILEIGEDGTLTFAFRNGYGQLVHQTRIPANDARAVLALEPTPAPPGPTPRLIAGDAPTAE